MSAARVAPSGFEPRTPADAAHFAELSKSRFICRLVALASGPLRRPELPSRRPLARGAAVVRGRRVCRRMALLFLSARRARHSDLVLAPVYSWSWTLHASLWMLGLESSRALPGRCSALCSSGIVSLRIDFTAATASHAAHLIHQYRTYQRGINCRVSCLRALFTLSASVWGTALNSLFFALAPTPQRRASPPTPPRPHRSA